MEYGRITIRCITQTIDECDSRGAFDGRLVETPCYPGEDDGCGGVEGCGHEHHCCVWEERKVSERTF